MNWELAFKIIGGSSVLGLLGLLLKYFVVSAPVTFAARRSDAATLIADLQKRVVLLEKSVRDLQSELSHTLRERDALFVRYDMMRNNLLLAAQMHADGETPGPVMVKWWQNVPDAQAVVDDVMHPHIDPKDTLIMPVPETPPTTE